MKKIFFLFLIPLLATGLTKAQYVPVDKASTLTFKIGNFGFDVNGSFTGFKGTINFDPQNIAAGSFDVTIDAATVNTDNNLRDEHLRGASYFDAKKLPGNSFCLIQNQFVGKLFGCIRKADHQRQNQRRQHTIYCSARDRRIPV